MNKDVDNTKLFITSNTVLKFKQSLIEILELNKQKVISVGAWVAVAYQNNWYPCKVTNTLNEDTYTVNFMKPKKSNVSAFICPSPLDVQEKIENKSVMSSHFKVIPTSVLRFFFIIPEYDEIQSLYLEYVNTYF